MVATSRNDLRLIRGEPLNVSVYFLCESCIYPAKGKTLLKLFHTRCKKFPGYPFDFAVKCEAASHFGGRLRDKYMTMLYWRRQRRDQDSPRETRPQKGQAVLGVIFEAWDPLRCSSLDLCDPHSVSVLERRARQGDFDVAFASPPCSVVSRVRHRGHGPPPLVSRASPLEPLPQLSRCSASTCSACA